MADKQVLDKAYEDVAQITQRLFELWRDNIVFTFRWWIGVLLAILPWLLWIKYRDRNRTGRLLFVGFVIATITNILDVIGLTTGRWHYEWKIFPTIVSYLPWDYSLFPVFIMFMLQIKPQIKPIIKAIIFGIFCAFVFEPFFEWVGIYRESNWRHYYSFVIYTPLYLFCNWLYKAKFLGDLK